MPAKRGDGAGAAEHLHLAALDAARDMVARLESRQRVADLAQHGGIGLLGDGAAVVAVAERHDAMGQRDVVEHLRRMARVARQAQPHQLGRAAADVEDDGEGRAAVEQRRAAGDHQPRLLVAGDDLDGNAGLGAHPLQELVAVLRAPAGLGADRAREGHPAPRHLAGADRERLEGAVHGGVRKPVALGEPLAEPDDAGEGVDDAEAAPGPPGHQKAAVVGPEVDRRERLPYLGTTCDSLRNHRHPGLERGCGGALQRVLLQAWAGPRGPRKHHAEADFSPGAATGNSPQPALKRSNG